MVRLSYKNILNSTMLPSKSANYVDEVSEASLFFLTTRTNAMDGGTFNSYNSLYHPSATNRYSSSTDSMSPESYLNTWLQPMQPIEQLGLRAVIPNTFDNKLNSWPLYNESHIHNNVLESPSNHDTSNYSLGMSFDSFSDYSFPNRDNTSTPLGRNCSIFQTQDSGGSAPLQIRRLRPIVGRKILGCHSNVSVKKELKLDTDFEYNTWQPKQSSSPEHNHTQYELFPCKEQSYEFNTVPSKSDCAESVAHTLSPTYLSVTTSRMSPMSNNAYYMSKLSNATYKDQCNELQTMSGMIGHNENEPINMNRGHYPPITSQSPTKVRLPPPSPVTPGVTLSHNKIGGSKLCTFCRKNGESPKIFLDHYVKEKIGNVFRVTCPILRALVCLTCGASGDNAHTITYCPVLRSGNRGKPLPSTTVTLKSTPHKSNGRRRY